MRRVFVWLALAASLGAQSAPAKKSALDKATMEDYVRRLFVWPSQINVKVSEPKPSAVPGFFEVIVTGSSGPASQDESFLVSLDGQKILRAVVFDVNRSPFQNDLDKLKTDLQPSFGTPGAPAVVVLFSDFQCGFCKEEALMLRTNLLKTYPTQVRVYFKDFPLTSIHPWAKPAAIAGRCVFREKPAAFWEYHDWIYNNQQQITPENLKEKVLGFAKEKGLDSVPLTACMDTKATEKEVDRELAEGKALGINSTPTMFLNGRRFAGQVAWPQLQQIIDFELNYQKTHPADAVEKCCEVKLPSPLNH